MRAGPDAASPGPPRLAETPIIPGPPPSLTVTPPSLAVTSPSAVPLSAWPARVAATRLAPSSLSRPSTKQVRTYEYLPWMVLFSYY